MNKTLKNHNRAVAIDRDDDELQPYSNDTGTYICGTAMVFGRVLVPEEYSNRYLHQSHLYVFNL